MARPAGFTVTWPISPANPPAPVSSRPSTIRPPPTPTSPDTNSTLSTPTAAPRRCSPRTPASASFSTLIGTATDERAGEAGPEGDVDPAEVGGHRHQAVRAGARCRRPRRRCRRSASRRGRAGRRPARARSATTSSTDSSPARPVEPDVLQRLAAQADDRRRDRVDEDLEAEDHRAGRVQAGRSGRDDPASRGGRRHAR